MNKIFLLTLVLFATIIFSCKKGNSKRINISNDLAINDHSIDLKIQKYDRLTKSLIKEVSSEINNIRKKGIPLNTLHYPSFYTGVQELENQLNTKKVVTIKNELIQLTSDLKEVYPDWPEQSSKVLVDIREDLSVSIRY